MPRPQIRIRVDAGVLLELELWQLLAAQAIRGQASTLSAEACGSVTVEILERAPGQGRPRPVFVREYQADELRPPAWLREPDL